MNIRTAVPMAAILAFSNGAIAQDPNQALQDYSTFNETEKSAVCLNIQDALSSLEAQLPLQIDSATQLISTKSRYQSGRCELHYTYQVNETALLDMVGEETFKLLGQDRSDSGASELKRFFEQKMLGNEGFANLVQIPFVSLTASYEIAGDHLKPFTLSF